LAVFYPFGHPTPNTYGWKSWKRNLKESTLSGPVPEKDKKKKRKDSGMADAADEPRKPKFLFPIYFSVTFFFFPHFFLFRWMP
jgi:hypothetical protein